MPQPLAYSALLLAASPLLGNGGQPAEGAAVPQSRIQQRVVIRIPRMAPPDQATDAPRRRWTEKKGPKCVPLDGVEGASLSRPDAVDLLLTDGERMRALLGEDCSPMDFYSGFYIKGTADGMICADRDAIRMRSGGSCRIDGFRRLVARR